MMLSVVQFDSIVQFDQLDEKAIQKINAIKNKKPKYNVLFNNCADLVRDILDAAGIDLPWRLIDTPTKLENDLKNK